MKHLLSSFLILLNLLSTEAFGMTYVPESREQSASLEQRGVGGTFFFKWRGQNVTRMRVEKITHLRNGQIKAEIVRDDNKIRVSFEPGEGFSYRPLKENSEYGEPNLSNSGDDVSTPASTSTSASPSVPTGTNTGSTQSSSRKTASPAGSSSAPWTDGMGAASIAGLSTGLILLSGYEKEIQAAYDRIKQLEAAMGADFAKVEEAHFDLKNQTVSVLLQSSMAGVSSEILQYKLGSAVDSKINDYIDQSDRDASSIELHSNDSAFLARAQAVQSKLINAVVKDSIDQSFYDVSKQSLLLADQESVMANKGDANTYLKLAEAAADVLVGLDPFTGFARSLYESVIGSNMITGAQLTPAERTLAVVGVITAGSALEAKGVFKAINVLASKIAPEAKNALSVFGKVLNRSRLSSEAEETIERSINYFSKADKDWGLTKEHLNKHLFGNSRYSLSKIDPGGTPAKWFQHIEELMGRPVTEVTSTGKLDIKGLFEKADGSGTFKMGVRLSPNEDGSFDLVTLLTDQRR